MTETKKDHQERGTLSEGRVEPSNRIYRGQHIVIGYDKFHLNVTAYDGGSHEIST